MTGLILAIARAAGEVAPLDAGGGAVKLAPTLPMDGNFPYLHVERKFMHLGFHIYRCWLPEPECRGGTAAGVCHFLPAGDRDRRV